MPLFALPLPLCFCSFKAGLGHQPTVRTRRARRRTKYVTGDQAIRTLAEASGLGHRQQARAKQSVCVPLVFNYQITNLRNYQIWSFAFIRVNSRPNSENKFEISNLKFEI